MHRSHSQTGQILPVLLAIISIAVVALTLADRVSTAMADQSRMTDAADSAAYSAAVWTARRMNFIAYSNRAMLANHIAVGHLVAYISWLRYVDASAERIQQVTQWLTVLKVGIYMDAAVRKIRNVLRLARLGTEITAAGYITIINTANISLGLSHLEALRLLSPDHLQRVKTRVVKAHDESFIVNTTQSFNAAPEPWGALTKTILATLTINLLGLADIKVAPRNDPFLNDIVDATIEHDPQLKRWVSNQNERGWSIGLVNVVRFRKLGDTERPPEHPADNWQSSDRFQWSVFNGFPFGWGSWSTLASGKANVQELGGVYAGIASYIRINPSRGTHPRLVIPALVSTDDERPNTRLGLAAVEYRIPPRCERSRCPSTSQVATLFNPYWSARLISPEETIIP